MMNELNEIRNELKKDNTYLILWELLESVAIIKIVDEWGYTPYIVSIVDYEILVAG